MTLKVVLLQTLTYITLIQDILTTGIPEYDRVVWCNSSIQSGLGTKYHAGLLVYDNDDMFPNCNVTIETANGYRLAYRFQTITESREQCLSKVIYDNGFFPDFYCANQFSTETHLSRNNKLTLQTEVSQDSTTFAFQVLFMSFHDTVCFGSETLCNGLLTDTNSFRGCVDNSLVCHGTYPFCAKFVCSDTSPSRGSTNTAVVVAVPVVSVILLAGVLLIICYKKGWVCNNRRSNLDIERRRTLMNIYTTQFTGRGVDGNENVAYLDDRGRSIDFTKFEPPPEYGSLEQLGPAGGAAVLNNLNGLENPSNGNLDNGRINSDSTLPSYGDAMQNFDQYQVQTQL